MVSAVQETWVQSLGQEDPLEKRMATHSSILGWEILWTERPVILFPLSFKEPYLFQLVKIWFVFFVK